MAKKYTSMQEQLAERKRSNSSHNNSFSKDSSKNASTIKDKIRQQKEKIKSYQEEDEINEKNFLEENDKKEKDSLGAIGSLVIVIICTLIAFSTTLLDSDYEYEDEEKTLVHQIVDTYDYDQNTSNTDIVKDIEEYVGEEGLVDVSVKDVKNHKKQLEDIVKKRFSLKNTWITNNGVVIFDAVETDSYNDIISSSDECIDDIILYMEENIENAFEPCICIIYRDYEDKLQYLFINDDYVAID